MDDSLFLVSFDEPLNVISLIRNIDSLMRTGINGVW